MISQCFSSKSSAVGNDVIDVPCCLKASMDSEGKTVRLNGKIRKSTSLIATAKKIKNLKRGPEKNVKTFEVGRRVIDINNFGKKFDSGCEKCGETIKWKNLFSESQYGLCCALHFKCNNCLFVTKIYSSTRSSFQGNRRPFSVNVKAALAMIHGGIGPRHLNSILSTIGLPVVNQKTLKKRERDIGPVIETVAKKSCLEASENEKRSTMPFINETGDNEQQMTFEEALDFLETDNDDAGNSEDFFDHETGHQEYATSTQASPDSLDLKQNKPMVNVSGDCAYPSDRKNDVTFHIPNDQEINRPLRVAIKSPESSSLVQVTVSQDAAWSKRGRAMNSLSGVGHVIGFKTRRCLNFSTRNKLCKKCTWYQRVGKPVPEHDCRANWHHSAKAMEPDIAVQLHKESTASGLKYANVIGDEDSSSMKHIREKVNSDVKKYSDITHLKRSLTNKLIENSKAHPSLTEKVRQSFLKNFVYAVQQNKNSQEKDLELALRSIVPHMFGDHALCGQWCGHKNDSYRHANLPHGKDLSDPSLEAFLSKLLQPFIDNPLKLMTTGDSQANESLNNVIFSKAPKIRNYNLSESFDYRCSAGVLQFNEGPKYVETVINESNLSPRKETSRYVAKEEKKRKYIKAYKSDRKKKKRRIELKLKRKQKDLISNIKLGLSYETDCTLNSDDVDITEISDPPKPGNINCNPTDVKTIYFDIETTKLGYAAEITQLAACLEEGVTAFNTYILPDGQISPPASRITGLEIKVENGKRQMFKNGKRVDARHPKEGLASFINWIKTINGNKILCAHNGCKFDFPILFCNLLKYDILEEFAPLISGVVDSIDILKLVLPNKTSYALSSIYNGIFNDSYEMHDARADVEALVKICENIKVNAETILKLSIDTSSAIKHTRNVTGQRSNINALQNNLSDGQNKIISDRIAGKMCRAGVSFDVLMLAHARDNENGIRALLSEKIDQKVRVTNRKSIIETLVSACNKKQETS